VSDGERTQAEREATGDAPGARRGFSMFDRCAARARLGAWECDLATEALTWTDGVYDLFDLPRGSRIDRATAKAFYDEASCRAMERLRSRAIAERNGFGLDIHITTARGIGRWIRITADVECRDGRPVCMFGLKQDVTREKQLVEQLRRSAERDALTGLANRTVFEAHLARAEAALPGEPRLSGLVLLDVDRFKLVNDTLGHAAGDDCLRAVAATLSQGLGPGSVPARLGGDEFAVLLYDAVPAPEVERRVTGLVARNRRALREGGIVLEVSVSAGLACMPRGGLEGGAAALVRQADLALYAAKAAGRDTVRCYDEGIRAARLEWARRHAIP
jgi:diguanylate cyclase (GGDEF)-like protein